MTTRVMHSSGVNLAELYPNTATPSPEVFSILGDHGLSEKQVLQMGWYAYPKLGPPRKGRGRRELHREGLADALAVMEPFLSRRELTGTIRTMEMLNGCLHQCHTCHADSALPTTMFSYDSLDRLFDDDRFVKMLDRQSFRIGVVADLLNHPRGVEIAAMILRKTTPDQLRGINIYVNYRPHIENQLDEITDLAAANPDRILLTVSLPFNSTDRINWAFHEYIKRRPQLFDTDKLKTWADGMWEFLWDGKQMRNFAVLDVRHATHLFIQGRVLPMSAYEAKARDDSIVSIEENAGTFHQRGLVRTFLNSDALWLMTYTTPYESHTTRAYTPITPENLSILSYLHYYPRGDSPPHWPGGVGTKDENRGKGEYDGQEPKPLVIVGT